MPGLSNDPARRLIRVGSRKNGGFRDYTEVGEYLAGRQGDNVYFKVRRRLDTLAFGGLLPGDGGVELVYVSDGSRQARYERANEDNVGVTVQVDPDDRFTERGNLIAHVETWDNTLLDRGLAWIALTRNELECPLFSVGVLPDFSATDPSEIAQRLQSAEAHATQMLEDMLNGVTIPRYSADFPS